MKSEELMLKIENVSKVYRLGEIGGTTLRDELQRLKAKIFHKEDPTKKVGSKNYNKGDKFKALDNVSFEVRKGERIGIIGHNGAGKSTLLKLISRVTGPSDGNIFLNGRVASMLEVGTGFHAELTGRENIYLNGAILGMTKKEIDAKMEDIIKFSEVRQFIDTPVKRYSSGMYVKLAFSVAAHLDSEIMIMDEVLAVGDVAFQNKCLNKMRSVSEEENKTILYVSHNMNTIKKLCDRVIVLKSGKIIYDGDVLNGINLYMNGSNSSHSTVSLIEKKRLGNVTGEAIFTKAFFPNKSDCVFNAPEIVRVSFLLLINKNIKDARMRINVFSVSDIPITSKNIDLGNLDGDQNYSIDLSLDTKPIAPGSYWFNIAILYTDDDGRDIFADYVNKAICFEFYDKQYRNWNCDWWGYIKNFPISISLKKNP